MKTELDQIWINPLVYITILIHIINITVKYGYGWNYISSTTYCMFMNCVHRSLSSSSDRLPSELAFWMDRCFRRTRCIIWIRSSVFKLVTALSIMPWRLMKIFNDMIMRSVVVIFIVRTICTGSRCFRKLQRRSTRLYGWYILAQRRISCPVQRFGQWEFGRKGILPFSCFDLCGIVWYFRRTYVQ